MLAGEIPSRSDSDAQDTQGTHANSLTHAQSYSQARCILEARLVDIGHRSGGSRWNQVRRRRRAAGALAISISWPRDLISRHEPRTKAHEQLFEMVERDYLGQGTRARENG